MERKKPNALRLLDELFVNPYLTAARAAQILASSRPTARQAIGLLQEEGLVQEVSGSSWRRIYLARPILEIIESGREPRRRGILLREEKDV